MSLLADFVAEVGDDRLRGWHELELAAPPNPLLDLHPLGKACLYDRLWSNDELCQAAKVLHNWGAANSRFRRDKCQYRTEAALD
jgi:hypothetical protein